MGLGLGLDGWALVLDFGYRLRLNSEIILDQNHFGVRSTDELDYFSDRINLQINQFKDPRMSAMNNYFANYFDTLQGSRYLAAR